MRGRDTKTPGRLTPLAGRLTLLPLMLLAQSSAPGRHGNGCGSRLGDRLTPGSNPRRWGTARRGRWAPHPEPAREGTLPAHVRGVRIAEDAARKREGSSGEPRHGRRT
jgi:hypothetical protein